MMKRFINKLLDILIRFFYSLYPYQLSRWFKAKRELLYTKWIRNALGAFGENSSIGFPCMLQGGGEKRLTIGHNTRINAHAVIGLWSEFSGDTFTPIVKIGNHCNIGEYCHISAINKITIGDGLLTGRFVYIGDNSHGGLSWEEADIAPEKRKLKSKGDIMIGKNVWIGDKATILGGVTIGDNAIIGAGTVVTHDVPPNSVVGGGKMSVLKQLE